MNKLCMLCALCVEKCKIVPYSCREVWGNQIIFNLGFRKASFQFSINADYQSYSSKSDREMTGKRQGNDRATTGK